MQRACADAMKVQVNSCTQSTAEDRERPDAPRCLRTSRIFNECAEYAFQRVGMLQYASCIVCVFLLLAVAFRLQGFRLQVSGPQGFRAVALQGSRVFERVPGSLIWGFGASSPERACRCPCQHRRPWLPGHSHLRDLPNCFYADRGFAHLGAHAVENILLPVLKITCQGKTDPSLRNLPFDQHDVSGIAA